MFTAAILSAPMLDIVTNALPKQLARLMAKFSKAAGTFEKYVPGGEAWDESKDVFAGNNKTSDPVRFTVQTDAYKNNPQLRMGDATYGWVYHAFQSIDVLNREDYLKSIKTPILMEISGDDKIVDKTAAQRAAKIMPHCTTVDILPPQNTKFGWSATTCVRRGAKPRTPS